MTCPFKVGDVVRCIRTGTGASIGDVGYVMKLQSVPAGELANYAFVRFLNPALPRSSLWVSVLHLQLVGETQS